MEHYVHIYQRPRQGNAFIARYLAYNYRHRISAVGGFDSMSCALAPSSADEGKRFVDDLLGCRVAVHVDNPAEPIWEGFINRIRFGSGGIEWSISLDEMYNRSTVTYTTTGTTQASTTTATNDTNSQSLYGIKQINVEQGVQANATAPNKLRDTNLAVYAWPQPTMMPLGGKADNLIHLECKGFYDTLSWETFSDTSGLSATVNSVLTSAAPTGILLSLANGTTFFNRADFSDIENNATSVLRERRRGQTAWDIIKEFQELGDAGQYWVAGITPTDPNTGERRFYFKVQRTAIDYTTRLRDGLQLRDVWGRRVDPWRARPDAGVRITDSLIAWDGLGDNPTESWIAVIEYDANTQRATWRGLDDTAAEGVFNMRRANPRYGRSFGAGRRVV